MEEYRCDARNAYNLNESLVKENDTLKYRLEEGVNMMSCYSPRAT